jgi:hypothetical protein
MFPLTGVMDGVVRLLGPGSIGFVLEQLGASELVKELECLYSSIPKFTGSSID